MPDAAPVMTATQPVVFSVLTVVSLGLEVVRAGFTVPPIGET